MGSGRGKSKRAKATATASKINIRKRLGELHAPRELRAFMESFDAYYRDNTTNTAEIIAAIPDGADIIKAIDETALWLLTDRKYGIAAYVPQDSPNQKPLRALKRLITKKINGEYVDKEDFEKINTRFIYNTMEPGEIERYQEDFGWTPPKYKSSRTEESAIMAAQECLCSYDHYNNLGDTMSWIAEGDASSLDRGMEDTAKTREAFQALISTFKGNIRA